MSSIGKAKYPLLDSGVTPGTYALATLIIDRKGRVTSASAAPTTGSGSVVLATNPVIAAPTIADLTNMTHIHQSAASGGSLDAAAIGSGLLANARVNWAAPSAYGSTTPAAITGTIITATTALNLTGATSTDIRLKKGPAVNGTGNALLVRTGDDSANALLQTGGLEVVVTSGVGIGLISASNSWYWFTDNTSFRIASTMPLNWVSSTNAFGTADVGLVRDAAGIIRITNGSTGVGAIGVSDAAAGITNVAILDHVLSSGGASAGFGPGLLLRGTSSTAGTTREMGRVRTEWTTATDLSRASKMVLSVYDLSSEVDVMTLTNLGLSTTGNVQAHYFTDYNNSTAYVNTFYDNLHSWALINRVPAKTAFSVQGAPSQSANLQEWQDSTAAILAKITSAGVLALSTIAPLADSTTALKLTKADGTTAVVTVDTTNSRIGINVTPSGSLDIKSTGTAYTDKVVRATDSASVGLFAVTGDGRVFVGADTGAGAKLVVSKAVGDATGNNLASFKDNSVSGTPELNIIAGSSNMQLELSGSSGKMLFGNLGRDSQALTLDTATGYVGIGTTSPVAILHVALSDSNSFPVEVARFENTVSSDDNFRILIGSAGLRATYLEHREGSTIYARITLNTNGTVSVGNSATDWLSVTSAASTLKATDAATATVTDVAILDHSTSGTPAASYGTGLRFRGQDSTTASQEMGRVRTAWTDPAHLTRASKMVLSTYNVVSEVDVLTILSSGNVGIGTPTPGALLEIKGSGSHFLRISAATNHVELADASGNIKWYEYLIGSDLSFYDTSDRLYLKAGGNIGIGTTSPSGLLDVNDDHIRVRTAKTPATAGAAGNQGDIAWDSSFLYTCVATNTWRRTAHASW